MNEPVVVEFDHVSKVYPLRRTRLRGERPELRAVDDVTLAIADGETVGLVGESGSGKSTLGRLALALDEPTSGSVRIGGVDPATVHGSALRSLRRSVQGVFQDPSAALDPRRTIGQSIAESARLDPESGDPRERVAELLHTVGLDPARMNERPRKFSGGQRQRVVIARALAARPRVLIADEPVSALDVSVQAQVLNLLRELQETRGLTTLFISHDLAVVAFVAQRVAVMFHGVIVETGTVAEVLAQPAHPYTVTLKAAASREDDAGAPPEAATEILLHEGCVFRARCPIAMPRCAVERPVLTAVASGREVACHAVVP